MRINVVTFVWVLVLGAAIVRAETSVAERVAAGGAISEVHGVRVLHLKGGDVSARGFAHGYLLAEESIKALETAITSLPGFNVERYEQDFLPWARANFVWDADSNAEMDAMFAGMTARIGGEGFRSKLLGRAFTRDDLVAVNTLADYFGPACSAFAAWGARTPDGKLVHGRTLDFPIGADAVAAQLIFVNDPLPARGDGKPARRGFIAVGWPGMIAHYTGMSDAGLVACIHDGYNLTERGSKGVKGGCIARGLLLRRVMEMVDPTAGDPAEAAAKLTSEFGSACGNLFHLSWPLEAAKKAHTAPSAVLEFEPSMIKKATLIRRPEQEGFMVLTNHFCLLNKATDCERCAHINAGIEMLQKAASPIGLKEARKLLMSAEQPVAAHSVYFYPDALEFHLALTKKNVMSPRVAPVKFTFAELFAK